MERLFNQYIRFRTTGGGDFEVQQFFRLADVQRLKCQRCRQIFTSTDRKPYHLPCNREHIVCGQCIRDLLARRGVRTVKCPKCFKIHEADRGPNSFHILKDRLSIVRKRERLNLDMELQRQGIGGLHKRYKFCEEHHCPKVYYCVAARCSDRSVMCIACLARHSNIAQPHYWINIRDFVKSTIRYQVNRGITFLERALQTPNRD